MTVPLTLAAAPGDGALFGQILPWLVALLGVVVIGGVGIWILRRMLKQDARGDSGGFTLQDLREMKASGQLNEEEYTRARDSIIGRLSEPSAPEHEPEETTDP